MIEVDITLMLQQVLMHNLYITDGSNDNFITNIYCVTTNLLYSRLYMICTTDKVTHTDYGDIIVWDQCDT